jgi:hypothetical protein
VPATVAECESCQTTWNLAIATAGGGTVWEDAGLRWSWQAHDGQLMLNFPSAIDAAAVRRGLELARRRDARIVGAWLSADTDATPLEEVGFERGWEPWWMAASLDAIAEPDDPRVTLSADVPEYGPAGQLLLSLAKGQRPRACHAVARVEGRFATRVVHLCGASRRYLRHECLAPVPATWAGTCARTGCVRGCSGGGRDEGRPQCDSRRRASVLG